MNFLNRIIRLAKKSDLPQRHASLVVQGGRVLGWGFNHEGRHSEVAALSKLWPSSRRGVTVINIRIRKDSSLALARPCSECEKFMRVWGVRLCYFSTKEGGFDVIRL